MTEHDQNQERTNDLPSVPDELPILAEPNGIIFPFIMLPMVIRDENVIKLIDDVVVGDRMLALFALPENRPEAENVEQSLPRVGTAATVLRMFKVPDGTMQVLVQGVARVKLEAVVQTTPYLRGRVEVLADALEPSTELEALHRNVAAMFQKAITLSPQLPDELTIAPLNINDPGKLADLVTVNLGIPLASKQEVLETLDVGERLRKVAVALNHELEILELGSKIQSQMKDQMEKQQREYYLREQLKAIQRELGEVDEKSAEIDELREKVRAVGLPQKVGQEAERELERLARLSPTSSDYSVIRTYLDWLVSLPWNKSTVDNLDLERAQTVLDEDHYDLEKVKTRIIEYLAVRKLKEDTKGPIICFVGPPGVGKTSLGQSIARAMGREFVRMSLGAVRDEAEMRGHRRTYVGAMPGQIIQAIRRVESNNPVFMLDEVDKLGMDFRGDPSAALLEVLDPAQNFAFVDHYLDVPFDLSRVMFIATANMLDPIPPALRDRMEIIELPGYTELEKLQIARRFLVPRQMKENGVPPALLEIDDEGLLSIIRHYTREAGVRNLEREIGSVCRKLARQLAAGHTDKHLVTADNLSEFLGHQRFKFEQSGAANEAGVATGLAVTAVGGEVLMVEVAFVPGHGGLLLTGQLGDVMQESAKAALTYVRSRAEQLGLSPDFYEKYDLHIHVPAGAVPKDGPSAGVTLATAVVSALTHRPVSSQVAMTGEVTLRGKVLPIGGIRDKVLAAHRAGIRTVILPVDNEPELDEVPASVRAEMRLVPVTHMDEVLNVALLPVEEAPSAILAGDQNEPVSTR